jgi:polar amino acid transport system substrate-binding protein
MKFSALTATAAGALTLSLFAGATTAQAQSLQCGITHTVQRGESLSQLALRAYGSASDFQFIYSANSAEIGGNPGIIRVGSRLFIPCIDGNSTSTADADAIRDTDTTEELPAPNMGAIRFVTATDWAPFLDEDQEQGGMLTEVANVAMANSDQKPDYKIDFINDWGSHLQPLISDHAYDFALAWFRPNCDFIDRLGDGSKFRCNNLAWSEPMFEQIFGYYSRADQPALRSFDDMLGKNVCRPAGYAIFMLEENGLNVDTINLARPISPDECFEGLVSGKYDVVAIASDTGEGSMLDTGTKDQVRYNENLSQVLTLHAVIAKNHPHRDDMLAAFDSGLKNIKASGEWFSIISRHMTEHRKRTQ